MERQIGMMERISFLPRRRCLQEPGLRVQGERQVHRGRDAAEPVPVVQVQKVPRGQDEERR